MTLCDACGGPVDKDPIVAEYRFWIRRSPMIGQIECQVRGAYPNYRATTAELDWGKDTVGTGETPEEAAWDLQWQLGAPKGVAPPAKYRTAQAQPGEKKR